MDNKESTEIIEQTTESTKLKGCYLLVILSAPKSKEDKETIIQKVAKALLSWDTKKTNCDLKELQNFWNDLSNRKEVEKNESDMLVQYANAQMAIEILYNAQIYTVKQCLRNLFQSFTAHKQIIFSGYTFCGTGNWILQDNIFTAADFIEQFNKSNSSILNFAINHPSLKHSIHLHCQELNDWKLLEDQLSKLNSNCSFALNPSSADGVPGAADLIDFLQENVRIQQDTLDCSEIVGNIRFNKPTFYVMPSGHGDCSIFGINGFTMLIDGGFNSSPSCWSFIRHLEKIDSVLITRFNENNCLGLTKLFDKLCSDDCTAPKVGQVLANMGDLNKLESNDDSKEEHNLEINLIKNGQDLLRKIDKAGLLQPKPLVRPHDVNKQFEAIELYHRIGFGTLNLYVLNPLEDSKLLNEFLVQFNEQNREQFSNVLMQNNVMKNPQPISLSNITSLALVLAWLPADLDEKIVRVLLPGSTPSYKLMDIFSKLQTKHAQSELGIMLSHEELTRAEFDKLIAEVKPKIQMKSNLKSSVIENETTKAKLKPLNVQRNRSMSPAVRNLKQDKSTPQFYDSLEALSTTKQQKNLSSAVNKKLTQAKSSTANVTDSKVLNKKPIKAATNKSNTTTKQITKGVSSNVKQQQLSAKTDSAKIKEKVNQNDKKLSAPNKVKKPKLLASSNLDFALGKAKSLGSMSESSETNTIKAYLKEEYEPNSVDSLDFLNSRQSTTLSKDSLEQPESAMNKKDHDEDSLNEQEIKTYSTKATERNLWDVVASSKQDEDKDFSLSPIEKQRNDAYLSDLDDNQLVKPNELMQDNLIMNQSTRSTSTVIENDQASISKADLNRLELSESIADSDLEYKEEDAEVQKIFESEKGLKRKILVLENNVPNKDQDINRIMNEDRNESIAVINRVEIKNEFNQSAIINENSKQIDLIKPINDLSLTGDINNNSFLSKVEQQLENERSNKQQLMNSTVIVPDDTKNVTEDLELSSSIQEIIERDNDVLKTDDLNEVPMSFDHHNLDEDKQKDNEMILSNDDQSVDDKKSNDKNGKQDDLNESVTINIIKPDDDKISEDRKMSEDLKLIQDKKEIEQIDKKLVEDKKQEKIVISDDKTNELIDEKVKSKETKELSSEPELKDDDKKNESSKDAKIEVQEEIIVPKKDVTKTGKENAELNELDLKSKFESEKPLIDEDKNQFISGQIEENKQNDKNLFDDLDKTDLSSKGYSQTDKRTSLKDDILNKQEELIQSSTVDSNKDDRKSSVLSETIDTKKDQPLTSSIKDTSIKRDSIISLDKSTDVDEKSSIDLKRESLKSDKSDDKELIRKKDSISSFESSIELDEQPVSLPRKISQKEGDENLIPIRKSSQMSEFSIVSSRSSFDSTDSERLPLSEKTSKKDETNVLPEEMKKAELKLSKDEEIAIEKKELNKLDAKLAEEEKTSDKIHDQLDKTISADKESTYKDQTTSRKSGDYENLKLEPKSLTIDTNSQQVSVNQELDSKEEIKLSLATDDKISEKLPENESTDNSKYAKDQSRKASSASLKSISSPLDKSFSDMKEDNVKQKEPAQKSDEKEVEKITNLPLADATQTNNVQSCPQDSKEHIQTSLDNQSNQISTDKLIRTSIEACLTEQLVKNDKLAEASKEIYKKVDEKSSELSKTKSTDSVESIHKIATDMVRTVINESVSLVSEKLNNKQTQSKELSKEDLSKQSLEQEQDSSTIQENKEKLSGNDLATTTQPSTDINKNENFTTEQLSDKSNETFFKKEEEDSKKEDTKKEEPKKEDTKKEDTEKEDPKKEEPKKEDTKKEDTKKEDSKVDECSEKQKIELKSPSKSISNDNLLKKEETSSKEIDKQKVEEKSSLSKDETIQLVDKSKIGQQKDQQSNFVDKEIDLLSNKDELTSLSNQNEDRTKLEKHSSRKSSISSSIKEQHSRKESISSLEKEDLSRKSSLTGPIEQQQSSRKSSIIATDFNKLSPLEENLLNLSVDKNDNLLIEVDNEIGNSSKNSTDDNKLNSTLESSETVKIEKTDEPKEKVENVIVESNQENSSRQIELDYQENVNLKILKEPEALFKSSLENRDEKVEKELNTEQSKLNNEQQKSESKEFKSIDDSNRSIDNKLDKNSKEQENVKTIESSSKISSTKVDDEINVIEIKDLNQKEQLPEVEKSKIIEEQLVDVSKKEKIENKPTDLKTVDFKLKTDVQNDLNKEDSKKDVSKDQEKIINKQQDKKLDENKTDVIYEKTFQFEFTDPNQASKEVDKKDSTNVDVAVDIEVDQMITDQKQLENLVKEHLSGLDIDIELNVDQLQDKILDQVKSDEKQNKETKKTNFGTGFQSASDAGHVKEKERKSSLQSSCESSDINSNDTKLIDNQSSPSDPKTSSNELDSKSKKQIEDYSIKLVQKASEFVGNLKNDEILEPDEIEEVESINSSRSDKSDCFELLPSGLERRHSHSTNQKFQKSQEDILYRRASESASLNLPYSKQSTLNTQSYEVSSGKSSANSLIGASLIEIASMNSAIVTKRSLTPEKETNLISEKEENKNKCKENENKKSSIQDSSEYEKIEIKEVESQKTDKKTDVDQVLDSSFKILPKEASDLSIAKTEPSIESLPVTTSQTDSKTEEQKQKEAETIVANWSKPLGLPSPLETSIDKNVAKNLKQNNPLMKSNVTSVANRQNISNKNDTFNQQMMLTSSITNDSSITSMKPFYFDLIYVAHHGEQAYNHLEFFKKCPSKNYVLSATNPSRETLDAMLEARKQINSESKMKGKQQTINLIPTHETESLFYWINDRQKELEQEAIEVAPSASRCSVTLQGHEDEVCTSYRIQF